MSLAVTDDLLATVRQILLCLNVQKGLTTLEEVGLDEEDLSFWLDSPFYETDPDNNEIIGVQADNLLGLEGSIANILNDDIVTTFLKSGDITFVVGTDGECTHIAGVDKETGVGLISEYDVEDEEWVDGSAQVAIANRKADEEGRLSDLRPLDAHYKRVVLKPNSVEPKQLSLSTKRLTELMNDVLMQRLSVATGKQVDRRSDI